MAGLTPEAVYAMLKRYVADTAIGLGALKGAPCTIKKIEKKDGVNTVTFEWTGTDGTKRTSEMKVNDGKDGNGSGEDGCGCFYTNDGVGTAVGNVKVGEKFDNVSVLEVLDRIFQAPYTKPTISIGISGNANHLYSLNNPSSWPSSITITANVGKKTYYITKVVFKVNGTVIETRTDGVSNGGKFTSVASDVLKAGTTTFTVEASDGTSTVTTSTQINVVGTSYSGYINEDQGLNDVNPSDLTANLKTTRAFTYTSTFPDDGNTYRIVYMYPKSFGAISTIKDNMGFENIQEYDIYEKTFDNIPYYVYISTPTGVSGLTQSYS